MPALVEVLQTPSRLVVLTNDDANGIYDEKCHHQRSPTDKQRRNSHNIENSNHPPEQNRCAQSPSDRIDGRNPRSKPAWWAKIAK
jgi:hypothetical protein